MNFITKKGLEEKLDKLDNGIDKFIVAGIYYGLNRSNYREQLLNIKTSSVNLEESTLTLPNGEKVVMDDLLKEVVREAVEQKIYVKMGSLGGTNEDYELNPNSEYIIKSKPTSSNEMGIKPLSNAGFKSRMRTISMFLVGDTSLTPSLLKKSGTYEKLKTLDKNLTIRSIEKILKESGYGTKRNTIVEMVQEIRNGGK
ncbi:TPA: hypothetical protein ACF09P_001033 [Clostridium perfringens]|uniref:hypothetical protein n=1 Tax=Clostridium perfringens TaxID=1502 RepID=UPI001CD01EEC|nr:hypothetical protein [Clostridium perfringens]EJT5936376.1 hypothetical protein [Clostridium perfringens]MDK0967382.1 hypothetical protein [Clostridium perfringens]MDU2779609.1 hypothetical protein [Clostridium perfringens]MDU3641347.1 hypothetical protein [Clostridium perfringens]MDV5090407.1 hypothetical protein [Clostridium perfringens]